MAPEIDFTDLSVRDVLDLAVAVEEEARQRYLEFADQMSKHHTQDAAEFFRRMADLERQHVERLQKRRAARFGDEPGRTTEPSPLIDVEAPEYHRVRAFMSVYRALDVALESERKAYRFYDDALQTVDDEEVVSLFQDLRSQEESHQKIIESFRSGLPPEDEASPDDYVDEPRAQ